MRARLVFWGCWLAGRLLANAPLTIANFDGAKPLAGWTVSRDPAFPGAEGSLAVGPGHSGPGAAFEYRFPCARGARCGGAVAAVWKTDQPVAVKHKAAISLWIRANPEVRIALLVTDKSEGARRYPFEVTSLEHSGAAEWRHVVIPLAAKSLGYGDEDHNGAPKGRIVAIGIVAEARYPLALRGTVAFDEVELLDSPDQTFTLRTVTPLTAPPPGSAELRQRLGINIHTLNDEHLLDAAHEAGFAFVRADLLWRDVERGGRYRFQTYDRLLNALDARGMGALWILDYGHPQHGGGPPRSREDVAAFGRFAQATAAHFKGRNVRYEVWNEPDTDRFWPPHPQAAEYAALLRETVEAIHRGDSSARASSGGVSRMDLPFLAATIDAVGAAGINAAAVHPYRKSGPEGLAAELPVLHHLLAGIGDGVEIWDTEWGYASYDYFSQNVHGDGHSAAGRKRQAVLSCRESLTVWSLGLPVAVWYDLKDDGDDPRNPEHNYGLLDAKDQDKPSLKALRTLTAVARDHSYAGMVPDVPDGAHAMRLDGSADQVFVVWSEQPDSRITVQFATDGLLSATNFLGEPLKLKSGGHEESEIALMEADGPAYLRFRSR